ncbi:winged helix-turn-helix transcriptional regulator [Tunturiibacter gelidoferens]|nr:helix-turn-helix domain-containing protein [Edaphobacter lichenicola]
MSKDYENKDPIGRRRTALRSAVPSQTGVADHRRWTPIVLFCIRGRTRRFNELQRSIPDISKKMLTQTLRKLEKRGLLNRLIHPVVPPHVDYSLTPAGNKFAEAVALLCEWAVQNKALLKQVAARGTH